MDKFERFELLLRECKSAVERTVFFRISPRADAEDVLQEVYLTAYHKFDTLMEPLVFKAWIIRIARNKCIDYYRRRAARAEIPMEMLSERVMAYGRCGLREQRVVRETLEQLSGKDRDILKLYYFQELPQAEIAEKLQVPLGTVKSRLHTARKNFRELYPTAKEDVGKEEGKTLAGDVGREKEEPYEESIGQKGEKTFAGDIGREAEKPCEESVGKEGEKTFAGDVGKESEKTYEKGSEKNRGRTLEGSIGKTDETGKSKG